MVLTVLSTLAWAAAPATLPSFDDPVRSGARQSDDSAVVIGIEDYVWAPDVPYARADARVFGDVLVYTRGIPLDRVRVLDSQATRETILDAVDAAAKKSGGEGTVWVYFAGHGAADPRSGERLLLGADAPLDPTHFAARSVTVGELQDHATRGGSKAFLVLDACYNGASRSGADLVAGRRFAVPVAAFAPETGTSTWFAAGPDQLSGPLDAAGHGAFTYFAVGALRGWADGELDDQLDGKVSGAEAQAFVDRMLGVAQVDGQHPEMTAGGTQRTLTRGALERGPESAEVRAATRGEQREESEPPAWSSRPADVELEEEAPIRASRAKAPPATKPPAARENPTAATPKRPSVSSRAQVSSGTDDHAGRSLLAEASVGIALFPTLFDDVEPGSLYRIAVGGGSERLQWYGHGSVAVWNGTDWSFGTEGTTVSTVGDGGLAELGAGVRWSPLEGPWTLALRGELGGAFYSSPMDPTAYAEEVISQLGYEPATGMSSAGLAAGGGVDGGIAILDDVVSAQASLDATFLTNPGFLIMLGGRVGLVARF